MNGAWKKIFKNFDFFSSKNSDMIMLKMTLIFKKNELISSRLKPKTYINVFHSLIFNFQTIILIICTKNK